MDSAEFGLFSRDWCWRHCQSCGRTCSSVLPLSWAVLLFELWFPAAAECSYYRGPQSWSRTFCRGNLRRSQLCACCTEFCHVPKNWDEFVLPLEIVLFLAFVAIIWHLTPNQLSSAHADHDRAWCQFGNSDRKKGIEHGTVVLWKPSSASYWSQLINLTSNYSTLSSLELMPPSVEFWVLNEALAF